MCCGNKNIKVTEDTKVKVGAKIAPTFIDMTSKSNTTVKVNVAKQSDTKSS